MQNKTIGIIIAVIIAVAVISAGLLAHFPAETTDGSNPTTINSPSSSASPSSSPSPTLTPTPTATSTPTPSPTAAPSPQLQTYTGYLVSYNYVTSQTNGVQSTQLVFTNKTFNYVGYIQLENDQTYNVTYDSNNPNQALNITLIDLSTGYMGNTEQASITNVVFQSNNQLTVTVINTGTDTVTINSATIDGNTVALLSLNSTTNSVAKGTSGLFTLSLLNGVHFNNTASYQIALTTAKGNTLVYTATYSGP